MYLHNVLKIRSIQGSMQQNLYGESSGKLIASLGVGGLQLRKRAQDNEDKTNVGFFLSTEDIDLFI